MLNKKRIWGSYTYIYMFCIQTNSNFFPTVTSEYVFCVVNYRPIKTHLFNFWLDINFRNKVG